MTPRKTKASEDLEAEPTPENVDPEPLIQLDDDIQITELEPIPIPIIEGIDEEPMLNNEEPIQTEESLPQEYILEHLPDEQTITIDPIQAIRSNWSLNTMVEPLTYVFVGKKSLEIVNLGA